MENEQKKLVLLATEVMISEEEEKLNPVFLSIKLKLADNAGNKNNEGITAAFISDLVNRQEEFECLPFYADVKNLLARNYDNLGHMYNRVTKQFSSTQIGSLTNFYSETDNDGVISLYATARVPKREKDICLRLAELYELGQLNVSVELRYNPEHTIQKDGVLFIDANEDNALTGLAVVSTPACPDAIALSMVASVADDSGEIVTESDELAAERGEMEPMEKEKITAEVTEEILTADEEKQEESVSEVVEETQETVAEEETVVSEDQKEANPEEKEDEEDKEDVVAESQETNAEVLEHSVDVHESVENWGGGPVHVIEYRERVIETMEDAEALIAELDQKVTALEEIESKYNALIAEQQEKELAAKRNQIRVFAEKQGLNVQDVAVAEAIENINYEKIAELTMAEVEEEKDVTDKHEVSIAGFVEMEANGTNTYGGLLNRKNK